MCAKRRILVAVAFLAPVVLVSVGGCATRYKGIGSGGGYFDYRLTEDVFAVSFRGNTSTYEELVDLYLLRRSAEVTLEHGYAYFAMVVEKARSRQGSFGYSSFKVPLVSPGTSIQIKCYKERPPDTELVIDAKQFLRFNFPKEYAGE